MGRLDEIEARLKAATPGPWETYYKGDHSHAIDGPGWSGLADVFGNWEDWGLNLQGKANADLVANAPADLAWCLEEIRRLGGGTDGRQ